MRVKELSSLEQEELWTDGWEALYRCIRGGRSATFVDDMWQEMTFEEAQGLIQDGAYKSLQWNLQETLYRGKRAIRVTLEPIDAEP